MRSPLDASVEQLRQGHSVTLITVMRTVGSTPSRLGMMLSVDADQAPCGTVGGGALEADALRLALSLEPHAAPIEHTFVLDPSTGLDQLCGGHVELRFERVDPGSEAHDALDRAAAARSARSGGYLVFPRSEAGACPPLRFLDHACAGPDEPDHALRSARPRRPVHLELEGSRYLVVPIGEDGRLHVVGAGHVGAETARLAARCGFDVVLHDERPALLDAFADDGGEAHHGLESMLHADLALGLESLLGPDDRVIAVTRSPALDEAAVAAALRRGARFVGMMGSRRKREAVFAGLAGRGHAADALARVECPIGLAIRAESPAELAVSIVARLIAHRAHGEAT